MRSALLAWLLTVGALAGPADAQGIYDFITFDGIDYIRWVEEPGRAIGRDDLGPEFATVECSTLDDRRACAYGQDAAAAFMPAGTRVYGVRGYRTDFRIAAVAQDRVFLYQAWRNPRAKVGGDLFDVAGRVRAIEVQRGERTPAAPGTPVRVTAAADIDALLRMILTSAMRPPRAHAFGEPRYWLTLWLADGTTLGRPYFTETAELMDGLALPPEFGRILDRYLGD
jgi:hypothetical protein